MDNLKFSFRTVPLVLLILCLLGFGLLIPWLGLYWDDWPVILMTRLQNARGFWEFYQYDRPISAWTYILTAPILGSRPIIWHVFTLLLRWLTVLGMWWSLSGLWPNRKSEVTWMAILFGIYPSFLQQPVAVAFSQHWITFGLFFLSIGSMIQAVRTPRWFWPLSIVSLLSCGLHIFTMEYFLGLEFLRPLILWMLFSERNTSIHKRLIATIKRWLPYLVIVAIFVLWRVYFLELAGKDPNTPELLNNFRSLPIPTLVGFFQVILQDVLHIIAGAWSQTITPANIDLTSTFFLLTVAASFLGGILTTVYLIRLGPANVSSAQAGSHWRRQALVMGLAAILLGFLPVWIAERQAIEGLYGSRFTLAATFGVSIIIVGLLDWFTPRLLPKVVLIGILVGFAISFQLENANTYRWSWITQQRFYWQLSWRAPYIQPNTALISDGELFPFVGIYSTTSGINLLYPQKTGGELLNYWFYSMGRGLFRQIPQLLNNMKLNPKFRTFGFEGSSDASLVIYYEPTEGRCLWILGPEDDNLTMLPELTQSVLEISDLDRIEPDPTASGYPPTDVFGSEIERTWCYYFEKADLARQMGDTDSIINLGKEARRNGHQSDHYRELLPFIEAYAYTGDWVSAHEWTMYLNPIGQNVELVCGLWQKLNLDTPSSPEKETNTAMVYEYFKCSP